MSGILSSFIEKSKKENFSKNDLSENEWSALRDMLDQVLGENIESITNSGLPVKRQIVESQCDDGHCYLRMIATLPSLRSCSIENLETLIINMKTQLKLNPFGKDLLTELAIGDHFLKNGNLDDFDLVKFESDHHNQTGFIKAVMSSKTVISMTERNGVKHLDSVMWEPCDCDQIVCEHGYASRFIYCVMINEGIRFGGSGDDDFLNDLFSEMKPNQNDPLTPKHSPVLTPFKEGPYSRYDETVELLSKLEDKNNTIEKLNQQLSKTLREKNRFNEARQDDLETIEPADSSSQIERYTSKKRYMGNGTVYTVNPKGKTVLTVIDERPSNLNSVNVVQGYLKTEEMTRLENKTMNKIAPINGLSCPFKSQRLNLLCHLHTALGSFKPPKEFNISLFDSMKDLLKYTAVTPSEELAYQLITRTFDLDRKVIIANPFKLPFIEIGMSMSDDSLNKCFSMLHMEYEMLWFSEMKSLKVPNFHNAFDKYKENVLTTSARGKGGGNKERRSSSSRKPSTILGF